MTLFGTAEVDWRLLLLGEAAPLLEPERSSGERERDPSERASAAELGDNPPDAEGLRWLKAAPPLLKGSVTARGREILGRPSCHDS
jgi:hypothetical protein